MSVGPHNHWRTIETWYSRYQKHGVTVMENKARSDKGKTRKVKPEDITEAIQAVLPKVHGVPKKSVLYRLCIEQGLLRPSQVGRTTFDRLVNTFELLKPESQSSNQMRLAFAKAHANQMWQADTLCGPYVQHEGSPVQTRLIAFIDDASRVSCHGQFFLAENVDTLIEALRAAFYKRWQGLFSRVLGHIQVARQAPEDALSLLDNPALVGQDTRA